MNKKLYLATLCAMAGLLAMVLIPTPRTAVVAQNNVSQLFELERFFQEPDFFLSDLEKLLRTQPGNLASKNVTCGGHGCTAAEAIYYAGNTFRYSLNVKLLVTLLDMQSGLVSHKPGEADRLNHPMGLSTPVGFEAQLAYVADALTAAYDTYQPSAIITFTDGTAYSIAAGTNPASYAIMSVLAQLAPDRATWEAQVRPVTGVFAQTLAQFDVKREIIESPDQQFPGDGDPAFLYQPYQGGAVGYTSYFDHDRSTSNMVIYTGATGYAYNQHDAYDYASNGRSVIATADGIIDAVYINYTEPNYQNWCVDGNGNPYPYSPVNAIVVRHDPDGDGSYEFKTYYWHMASISSNPATGQAWTAGTAISQGSVLGPTGTTGCSTGPHLHFSVYRAGRAFDPNGWAGSYADPWEPNFWLWAATNASYAAETMAIDSPASGAHVIGGVTLSGWAINRKYGPNAGVDQVIVYLDGEARTGTYLGQASYGDLRTDVGAAFGDARFNTSGWHLTWNSASVSPGAHTLYVYARSIQKNNWFFHKQAFIVDADTAVPTIAITQQPTTGTWYNADQTIAFTVSDAGSGPRGYKLAWDQNPPGGSEVAASSGSVNLSSAGQGQHTLYLQAWDNAGNPSAVQSVGWLGYDTVAPANPTSTSPGCAATSGAWQNTCADANFTWSGASDAASGVAGYEVYWGTDPNGTGALWSTTAAYNPAAVASGTYYLRVHAKDTAGNWSAWGTLFILRYDNAVPTGAVQINNNDSTAHATLVKLQTAASDTHSGLCQMRFRDAGGTWTDWQGYTTSTYWQLPGPTGQTFNVETQYKDCAGNSSSTYTDAIALNIYPARPASTNYRLAKTTFGASGQASTSTNYQLNATLGQPSMIGQMTSANHGLASGYWALRPLTTIIVTPNLITMTVGTTQTLTASGLDAYGNVLPITPTWTTDAGTLAGSVLTAQTVPATGRHVTATLGEIRGTASVNVIAGALTAVVVTPRPATITAGSTQPFAASGTDAFGNAVAISPIWNTDAGTMTGGILTTQALAANNKHVTATVGNLRDTVTFNIVAGAVSRLTLSPTMVTMTVGTTQQFTAVGFDVYNNVIPQPALVWQVAPSSLGIINAVGQFTAGYQTGEYPNAISVTSNNVSATAKVIVRWPHQVYLPVVVREIAAGR